MTDGLRSSQRFIFNGVLVAIAILIWPLVFYIGIEKDALYYYFGGYAFLVACFMSPSLDRLYPKAKDIVLGGLFGVIGVATAHATFGLLGKSLGFMSREVSVLFQTLAPSGAFDLVAMGAVIIAEELLFRTAFLGVLENRFLNASDDEGLGKKRLAIWAFSVVVYALAQCATLSISVFMAGVILGTAMVLLRHLCKSIWPCLIGHGLWTYGVVVVFPLVSTN